MRLLAFRSTVILLCSVFGYPSFSQGCSDAGFCTIGNLKLQRADSMRLGQRISLLLPVGIGDERVFVFTPGIQYDNQLSQRWAIQAKVTVNYADGNLGNVFGIGDIFLSGTHTFQPEKKWKISITLGTKLPLNTGNLTEEGKSLPMQYQSSLGTVDFITGFSIKSDSWQFSAGWQQPVSGTNANHFLPEYWGTPEAGKYPPTNEFRRKGDVLVRAAYGLTRREFSFNIGLLGIYHLDEDTYNDVSMSNEPISIAGSQGLTLNATVAAFWKVGNRFEAGFSAGAPLVTRDVRPDGLTRSFVLAPEIRWGF